MNTNKQLSFSVLVLVCLLLVTGCGSSLQSSGQVTATPAAPVAVGGQPSNVVPAPTAPAAAQAEVPTAPAVSELATTPAATDSPISEAATVSSPTQQVANAPLSGAGGDATDAIFRAYRGMVQAKSYRMKIMSPDATGKMATLETIEVIPPDRSHVVLDAGGGITSEYITIGNATFSKTGDAAWAKLPVDTATGAGSKPDLTDSKSIDEFRKSVSDVHLVGAENLDGNPTQVYQFKVSRTMTSTAGTTLITGVGKLWVAVSDGLPRKADSDSTMQFSGRSTAVKSTILYYDYNADIKIEAPVQ
jgi:hypothetical protein